MNVSRRGFLKASALAGGGLILGVHLPDPARGAEAADRPTSPGKLNAFVRVTPDDRVTVIVNHSEMGQGTYTSTAMLVAEELEADWSKVGVEAAPVDPAYNHAIFGIQMTGGSTSTWSEWDRLRKAGAAARLMLIQAAADTWQVAPPDCKAENGFVIHSASQRRLSYGQLAAAAALLKPPQNVPLKDPKTFKLIGHPTHRLDSSDKTNGKAVFGLDVSVPNMLVAVVARSPVFGGKVKSFNADKAKAIPGVRHVLQIERGVALVADGFWPAKRGRDALEIAWDEGSLANLDSKAQRADYEKLSELAGAVARKEGDLDPALHSAALKLQAVYELPYLAHATMEPMNCVADVREDRCEVWTGTQFQTVDRDAAAKDAGLKPEQVQLHTTFLGGGFGRRAVPDSHFVREAVQISKAIKAPVKVIWTREDDIRGGYYRPRAFHSISAGLDTYGSPVAWRHRIVCQSFIAGTDFESYIIKDGVDATAVEGAKDIPYEVPNILVEWKQAPAGVPTLWWRSVGHSHNAFVVETFVDYLAKAAGEDPFDYRLGLLGNHSRHVTVLQTVAEQSGWGTPVPTGRARGVALHESFGSILAQVAEVSISKEGKVNVHRVVCAIDCGPVVNPDTIRAQMESGIVFGLTAALYGEITFEQGRVRQRNFNDYQMLRIHETPEIEVHLVASDEKMGGVGETAVPPIAPAVANALFALTGKPIRRLPIRAEDLIG